MAPKTLSTRGYLLAIVFAVVIPLLLLGAVLSVQYAGAERSRYEAEAARLARQTRAIVDGELQRLLSQLEAFAASAALSNNDFEKFYSEVKQVTRGDLVLVLRDLAERQILNTQVPFGNVLPPAVPLSAEDVKAFVAGLPRVSGVYSSPLSEEKRIAVALPVMQDGKAVYVLAATIPTTRIRDAILPVVPPGWVLAVGDRGGAFVARSARHEELTGTPGLPQYVASVSTAREGTFVGGNREGLTLLAGFIWSDFSDWFFTANINRDVVEAPLWRSLFWLSVAAIAALTISGMLAFLFGKRLTAAATALADQASNLGRGGRVRALETNVREFQIVGQALSGAAEEIGRREVDRAAAEVALRQKSRELQTVLSTVPAAVWFTYDPNVREVVRNLYWCKLLGLGPEEANLENAAPALAGLEYRQDGRTLPDAEKPLQRAVRGDAIDEQQYELLLPHGVRRTLLISATPLLNDRGRIIGAVAVGLDISEREKAEEQRRLLVAELNHRVKNTLAIVQAITAHTLREADSLDGARDAVIDRLVALAKAHDLLTQENWVGAAVRDILVAVVAPHSIPGTPSERVTIEGPEVWLPPQLALSMALVFHELMTNATKYGSLSTTAGTIAVRWESSLPGPGEELLDLTWREHGGPTVSAPDRQGFGSRLIKRSLAAEDALLEIDYAPGGLVVHCKIRFQTKAPFRSG